MKYELQRDPSNDYAPKPYAFTLTPEVGEKWKLCSDTKSDHDDWCLELDNFLHVMKTSNSGQNAFANFSTPQGTPKAGSSGGNLFSSDLSNLDQIQETIQAGDLSLMNPRGSPPVKGAPRRGSRRTSFQHKKVLKLSRVANDGSLFDLTIIETFACVALVNYCLYLVSDFIDEISCVNCLKASIYDFNFPLPLPPPPY